MEPPTFLHLLLLITCAATGNAAILTYEMYEAVGSSVTFPGVNITERTSYDFIFHQQKIVTYHGAGGLRSPYIQRADFNKRTGEIVLRNLREDDSGTYEQVVNMRAVAHIYLHVIEPVNEPTLRKVNETIQGSQCLAMLECRVQGPNAIDVRFVKDGEEITENIKWMDNSCYLSLDLWDPGSPGTYSCTLRNRLGAKTSSDIKVPTQDSNCLNATRETWRSILIIASILISIIIVVGLIAYYGQKPNHKPGDVESGDNTTETSQLDLLLNQNPSEEDRKSEAPKTDLEEPRDDVTQDVTQDMTQDVVLWVPETEDTSSKPDLGHCGVSPMGLTMDRISLEHGKSDNG